MTGVLLKMTFPGFSVPLDLQPGDDTWTAAEETDQLEDPRLLFFSSFCHSFNIFLLPCAITDYMVILCNFLEMDVCILTS